MASNHARIQLQSGSTTIAVDTISGDAPILSSWVGYSLDKVFAYLPKKFQERQPALDALSKAKRNVRNAAQYGITASGVGHNIVSEQFNVDGTNYRLDVELTQGELKDS